jgi:chromosomal replication initiator protein
LSSVAGHGCKAPGDCEALAQLWGQLRDGLRSDLGARTFDQWLGRVRVASWCPTDRTLTLMLPSAFTANWVAVNFADRLLLAWRTRRPDIRHLRIVADDGAPATQLLTTTDGDAVAVPRSVASPFNERLCFDRFVVGAANAVPANAARALADGRAEGFSPLFIHSATGQGKTHLLHAIGNATTARDATLRTHVMSAERFMVDFVNAMRAKDTLGFKARLRSLDMLMIDDFQFIAGKGTTQEEFLHTIDELIGGGARLVITADRSPHALEGVDARLMSRLTQGLVVDLAPADLALRRAIVGAKAADAMMPVPPPVLDLLAQRIATSVRELEGALNRLVAYASLSGRAIDVPYAEDVLADMLRASQRRVTIDEIQRRVAEHFDMKLSEMTSARRARIVARPRQVAMYLAKQLTPRSLPEIGRRFGGRDHTTVIHAVRRIEQLRGDDADLDAAVRTLIAALGA